MNHQHPEYQSELDELARVCHLFLRARDRAPIELLPQLLLVGALIGQAANVYNVSPPGGLFDPASLFHPPSE